MKQKRFDQICVVYFNLEKGNLTEAKSLSKKISHTDIIEGFQEIGYSLRKSIYAANVLKRGTDWQKYCDSK